MARSLDQAIDRVQNRVNSARAAVEATRTLAWGLVFYGALVVVGRMFVPWLTTWFAVGTVGVVAAAALAAWQSRSGFYDRSEAAAWLDRASDAGGGILTYAAIPDRRFQEAGLPVAAPPAFQPMWFARRVVPALLFLIACFLVPAPQIVGGQEPRSINPIAQAELDALEERIERLERDEAVSDETIADLRDELERLGEEQRENPFGEASLEAIDAFEDRVEQEARESEEVARRTQEALEEARAGMAQGVDDQEMAQRREDLERAIQDMAAKGGLDGAPQALKEALGLPQDGAPGEDWQLPQDPQEFQKAMDELAQYTDGQWQPEACPECGDSQCDGKDEGEGGT